MQSGRHTHRNIIIGHIKHYRSKLLEMWETQDFEKLPPVE